MAYNVYAYAVLRMGGLKNKAQRNGNPNLLRPASVAELCCET